MYVHMYIRMYYVSSKYVFAHACMYVSTKLHVFTLRKTVNSMLAVELFTSQRARFSVQAGSIPAERNSRWTPKGQSQ